MASRSRVFLAFVALTAVLALAQPAAAGLIFFDDFEAAGNQPPALNTAPAGWTVANGTVDMVGTGGGGFGHLCAGSPSPGTCVDLDGSTNDAGILTKDFALGPAQYEISFWYRGNARFGSDSFTVGFGTASYSFVSVPSSLGWTQFSFLVSVPAAQNLTLSFSNGGGDNIGILIDNVSIEAVPEPGTLLLIGTGLTGLALRRRRRA